MSKNNQKIAIVLPAYNEARVIGRVLDELPRKITVSGKSYGILIIVVDDGSTDSTSSVVKQRKDVILIRHLLQSGAGAATRTGLHHAASIGCNYALTMDSDGQHSTKDVTRLINEIVKSQADFIIGSRLKQPSGNMPTVKKVGNIGLSVITFLLLGVYVSDTQSGLKALNSKALSKIDFHSNDYAFCSEMIWKAHQAKLKIEELPIKSIYTDYSVSKGQNNITGAIDIIKQLVKRRFLHLING